MEGSIKKCDMVVIIPASIIRVTIVAHKSPANMPFNENDLNGMNGKSTGTSIRPVRNAPKYGIKSINMFVFIDLFPIALIIAIIRKVINIYFTEFVIQ